MAKKYADGTGSLKKGRMMGSCAKTLEQAKKTTTPVNTIK